MLIPVVLENQITSKEACELDVYLVADPSTGPTTSDVYTAFMHRGIDVFHDLLVNAGGVTVSYYEWIQNGQTEVWELAEIKGRLEKAMKNAYRRVVKRAKQLNCDQRTAAYALALERLKVVYSQRGIFP